MNKTSTSMASMGASSLSSHTQAQAVGALHLGPWPPELNGATLCISMVLSDPQRGLRTPERLRITVSITSGLIRNHCATCLSGWRFLSFPGTTGALCPPGLQTTPSCLYFYKRALSHPSVLPTVAATSRLISRGQRGRVYVAHGRAAVALGTSLDLLQQTSALALQLGGMCTP